MKKIKLLIFLFVIFSCATINQTGLVKKTQLDSNKFKLLFKEKGFSEDKISLTFRFKRLAEVTLEEGFSYFSIIKYDVERMRFVSRSGLLLPEDSLNAGFSDPFTGDKYGGSINIINADSYTVTYIIQCYKEKPENEPSFDAKAVIRDFKKVLKEV